MTDKQFLNLKAAIIEENNQRAMKNNLTKFSGLKFYIAVVFSELFSLNECRFKFKVSEYLHIDVLTKIFTITKNRLSFMTIPNSSRHNRLLLIFYTYIVLGIASKAMFVIFFLKKCIGLQISGNQKRSCYIVAFKHIKVLRAAFVINFYLEHSFHINIDKNISYFNTV